MTIDNENRTQNCSECEFMKMYDYSYKNYYCDHEDRINDMGKLSVDHLSKTSPVWCPLREKNRQYKRNESNSDLPEAPRLEIYQETFDGLENVTEKWYKENE